MTQVETDGRGDAPRRASDTTGPLAQGLLGREVSGRGPGPGFAWTRTLGEVLGAGPTLVVFLRHFG